MKWSPVEFRQALQFVSSFAKPSPGESRGPPSAHTWIPASAGMTDRVSRVPSAMEIPLAALGGQTFRSRVAKTPASDQIELAAQGMSP